jgi:acetyl esterase/lipase
MTTRLIVAAALLAATPALPQTKPPELPRLMQARTVGAMPAAKPSETIRYGEGESQLVELYLPRPDPEAPDARRPVVVLVHGGCWQKSVAGIELLRPAAAAFLDKGFAVWSIGYRRVDEEGGGYPGTYLDVGAALDLIRDHAETHKLDPGRVVLYGHSAGGHLALWAAGRHRLPEASPLRATDPLRPRGVVSVGGFGSLAEWEKEIGLVCGEGIVAKLTPAVEGDARFADTSPDKLLPTGVPVVMLHGVFDYVAFPAMGLDHAQDARRAGDRAEVQVAPVAGHFEVIAPGAAAFGQAMAAVERLAR